MVRNNRQSSRSSAPSPSSSSSRLPGVQQPKATAPAGCNKRSTGDVVKGMAATAAGVAMGSAVGHAVGASVTNALSGRGSQQQLPAQSSQASNTASTSSSQQLEDGPCSYEIRQFLQCSEENSDLNTCQSFNKAVQQCRQRYNV